MTATNNDKALVPTVEAGVLNAVAQTCWQTSQDHGFHDDWEAAAFLEKLGTWLAESNYQMGEIDADLGLDGDDGKRDVGEYVTEIAEILRTNIIGMKLMLTVSELGEALETLRTFGASGLLSTEPYDDPHTTPPSNFGEELADAKIRLDDLSGYVKVAIGDVQMAKMAYNEGRPYKHGRKV